MTATFELGKDVPPGTHAGLVNVRVSTRLVSRVEKFQVWLAPAGPGLMDPGVKDFTYRLPV